MTSYDHPAATHHVETDEHGIGHVVPPLSRRQWFYWRRRIGEIVKELRGTPLYRRGYIARETELLAERLSDANLIPVPPPEICETCNGSGDDCAACGWRGCK